MKELDQDTFFNNSSNKEDSEECANSKEGILSY